MSISTPSIAFSNLVFIHVSESETACSLNFSRLYVSNLFVIEFHVDINTYSYASLILPLCSSLDIFRSTIYFSDANFYFSFFCSSSNFKSHSFSCCFKFEIYSSFSSASRMKFSNLLKIDLYTV